MGCTATVNLRMYPYATFKAQMTVRDSDGNVLDLTGHTALMHIRRDIEDEDPMFTLTEAEGVVLADAAPNIMLTIDAADTGDVMVDWDGETWVYDLLLTKDGETERVFQGHIVIQPGVTRP